MFIVLYPMGVLGEMWTVYSAQPLIRQNQILSLSMPNRANFAFSFYQATWMQQFLWPLGNQTYSAAYLVNIKCLTKKLEASWTDASFFKPSR